MKETKERASAPVEEPKREYSAEAERIRERVAAMSDRRDRDEAERAWYGPFPPRDFLAGGPAGRRVPWPRPEGSSPVETPKALEGIELAAANLAYLLLSFTGDDPDAPQVEPWDKAPAETREALDFFGREYQAAKALVRSLSTAPKVVEGRAPWLAEETPEEAEERYQAWRKAMEREEQEGEERELAPEEGGDDGISGALPWPTWGDAPESAKALAGLELAAAQAMRALLADGHFPTPPRVLEALDAFGRAFAAASVRVHSLEGLRDGMGAALVAFARAKKSSSAVYEYLAAADCVDILAEAGDAHDFLVEGMNALAAAGKSGNPLERLAAAIDGLEDAEMRDVLRERVRAFLDSRRFRPGTDAEGHA